MLCHIIHEQGTGCDQEIPEQQKWNFCPKCGSFVGHIKPPDGNLLVPENCESRKQLTFLNSGLMDTVVSCRISNALQGSHITPLQLTVRTGRTANLHLTIPHVSQLCKVADLYFEISHCKLRDPEGDPWEERIAVAESVELYARVQSPSRIEPMQNLAFFREGISERIITLKNFGGQPGEICAVHCPTCYSWRGDKGILQAGESREFTITRRWEEQDVQDAELSFVLQDNKSVTVKLCSLPPPAIEEIPYAIIGVDFGTAFTSIAYRKYNPNGGGTVEFITPLGVSDERFRTYIWVGKNHEGTKYGPQALRQYNVSQSSGYLFREIKTLLRMEQPNNPVEYDGIHPTQVRAQAVEFMKRRNREHWPLALVTDYLTWVYGLIRDRLAKDFGSPDVRVQYVFSLPVLDSPWEGSLYKLQRERMASCIEAAGFLMDCVSFEFEPVCAALGLLNPKNADWPRLATPEFPLATTKKSDRIIVFDSGGGTTDVALARIEIDENTHKLSLVVESCLGVDSDCALFGGEIVTDELLKALGDYREMKLMSRPVATQEWCSGTLNQSGNASDILGEVQDLELRGRAEELKHQLASSEAKDVPVDYTREGAQGALTVKPQALSIIVEKYENALAQSLDRHLYPNCGQGETRFYLCLGGNSRVYAVEQWLRDYLHDSSQSRYKRQLRVPEEDRTLAVAYGTVWVPDARINNAPLYELRVIAFTDKSQISPDILAIGRDMTLDSYMGKAGRLFNMPGNSQLSVRILATLDGYSGCVASFPITNRDANGNTLVINASVQNGAIVLGYKLNDQEMEINKYTL